MAGLRQPSRRAVLTARADAADAQSAQCADEDRPRRLREPAGSAARALGGVGRKLDHDHNPRGFDGAAQRRTERVLSRSLKPH